MGLVHISLDYSAGNSLIFPMSQTSTSTKVADIYRAQSDKCCICQQFCLKPSLSPGSLFFPFLSALLPSKNCLEGADSDVENTGFNMQKLPDPPINQDFTIRTKEIPTLKGSHTALHGLSFSFPPWIRLQFHTTFV